MTLIIHASDIPYLKKCGHTISVRDLQIFLSLYLSLEVDVVLYRCGARQEILKGPFVTPPANVTKEEVKRVLEKYNK